MSLKVIFLSFCIFLSINTQSKAGTTTIDSTNYPGCYTSIAIGTDGNPVISYSDGCLTWGSHKLKVTKCGNPDCSSGNTISFVDGSGAAWFTSIAIGNDGNPVIAYRPYSAHIVSALKVAKCGNPSCSSGNILTTLQSTRWPGQYPSIAIGNDGNPVISYYNWNLLPNGLMVAKCGNPSCSPASSDTLTLVDSLPAEFGTDTSIAIGNDGNPVIAYSTYSGHELKVAKCGNPSCSSGNTLTTIDGSAVAGDISIAIGNDGNPVISYYGASDLKVAKCGNPSCSSGNTLLTVDPDVRAGMHSSIAIGNDGNPVISYYKYKYLDGDLKVAICGNPSCSSGNTLLTVDSEGDVGSHSSIAIGNDGNPVISYHDGTNGALKVAVVSPFVDIGLRVYDGTSIIPIACEPAASLTSPLRIAKGGVIYGIALVETTDPNALKVRIKTPSGIKALRRY